MDGLLMALSAGAPAMDADQRAAAYRAVDAALLPNGGGGGGAFSNDFVLHTVDDILNRGLTAGAAPAVRSAALQCLTTLCTPPPTPLVFHRLLPFRGPDHG